MRPLIKKMDDAGIKKLKCSRGQMRAWNSENFVGKFYQMNLTMGSKSSGIKVKKK